MKRILLIWAVLMIALLNGCSDSENRFKVVERFSNGYYIMVDKETGVGYLNTGSGGITVMYDKDGEVYRPNGWRDYGT